MDLISKHLKTYSLRYAICNKLGKKEGELTISDYGYFMALQKGLKEAGKECEQGDILTPLSLINVNTGLELDPKYFRR
jgi:hypothetical protein